MPRQASHAFEDMDEQKDMLQEHMKMKMELELKNTQLDNKKFNWKDKDGRIQKLNRRNN